MYHDFVRFLQRRSFLHSGICLAFAETLLSQNCNVVFADLALRPEAQDLVSKNGGKDGGPRAVFVKTDVTDWAAISRMFEAALLEFGDFDVVCPGAGVYEPHWSSFWHPPGSPESKDSPDSGRYAMLDINLVHPIRTTQLALSYWLHPRPLRNSSFPVPAKASPQNPKRIIHVSSVAAQVPVFRAPIYGATKFAISGFVRSLQPLDSVGVRISAVAPGIVRTPLWTEHPEKLVVVDQTRDAWVTPQEVADAMVKCVEDESVPGGTILEVGAKCTRVVGVYNDPGPDGAPESGLMTGNSAKGNEMAWDFLQSDSIWGPPPMSS